MAGTMSGIAGFLRRDGAAASPEWISTMSRAIAHRGRDADGIRCDGAVALAQRMSWSTPESLRERQPLSVEHSALCLVADARIDNRDDLRRTLCGVRLETDADIIAAAYLRWGASCAERLTGDFAFALWDARERRLFCARDHMGVRPFYFFRSDRIFAFASEIKALLTLPEVPRELDTLQVAAFVEASVEDRERTFYSAVRRLPAAHSLIVGATEFRASRYWELDLQRETQFASSAKCAEEFRAVFAESVRARVRSAYPVSAALSGGLDSSSVVCMAQRLRELESGDSLRPLSLVFPSLPEGDRRLIDERHYIDSAARAASVEPTFIRADLLSPVDDVDQVLARLDEPYLAPNLYLHWAMYRAASECGARVFLDGLDGDTTVSHGLGRLNTFLRDGDWAGFEREVRAMAMHRRLPPDFILMHFGLPYMALMARRGEWRSWARGSRELSRRFGIPRRQLLIDHGLRPLLPKLLRTAYRAVRRREDPQSSLLRPQLARALQSARDTSVRDDGADAEITRSERESHAAGLAHPGYQLTLEMADKCAATFGVEPRYPFFDRRLIEFCLALPDNEKLDGGWARLVLRRAMDGVLPADVQWRSDKANLSPNFHRTLRASPATTFDTDALEVLAPFLNVDALRRSAGSYQGGTYTLAKSEEGHALFRVHVLSRWLLGQEKMVTAHGGAMTATAAA